MARSPSALAGRALLMALLPALAGPALAARRADPCGPEPVRHRLSRGETLYRVSVRYGIGVDDIAAANRIRDPRKVAAGTLLVVPCGSGAPERQPARKREKPGAAVLHASTQDMGGDFVEVVEPDPGTDLDDIAAASALSPAPPAAGLSPELGAGPAGLEWPVAPALSSPFGPRHGRRHAGIDLRAASGTPVRTAGPGIVADVRERSRGYGTVVTVNHPGGLLSLYAHLDRADVQPGQELAAGDLIGVVGQTGNATAPHLHFEIRREGQAENPLPWLPAIDRESEPRSPARAGRESVAAH